MQIKIPFLAEGVDGGTIVSILVRAGERIKKDQTIVELETNKATAPIPAPASGTVAKIHVKEGDEVSVGQLILTLSEAGAAKRVSKSPPEKSISEPAGRARDELQKQVPKSMSGVLPPASPSVRKAARELGIDLSKVPGSERGGRVTMRDLRSYIQRLGQGSSREVVVQGAAPSIDFSKWGPVTKKPLSSIRRTIAQNMYESWTTIPHVTQFDEADMASLLKLKEAYASAYQKKGARLTVTAVLLKAVVDVLKKCPVFNASFDISRGEIVEKAYYHLGVAVDTEHGLMVPVIRDVDQKGLLELCLELSELTEKARRRKLSLDDTQAGTFTVSNLGGIGGAHFTPIVPKPQVAILGVGCGGLKPVVRNGKIEARMMLPLCVSYDHRVIDGADGARFIREMVQALENLKEGYFTVPGSVKSRVRKTKK